MNLKTSGRIKIDIGTLSPWKDKGNLLISQLNPLNIGVDEENDEESKLIDRTTSLP